MPSLTTLTLLTLLPLVAQCTKAPGPSPGDLQISYTLSHSCIRPTRNGDTISAHYRGTLLASGTEFDSSYSRGDPLKFPLGAGRVIKGWDLGLLDMCPGDKRVLTIPPEMGYGSRDMGPIPAGSTLVFETELVGIEGVAVEERVVKKIADKVAEGAAAVGEGAASATSVVGEKVADAASAAGESAASATSVVGEKVGEAAAAASGSAVSAGEVVSEKAGDAAAAAGETVSEAAASVKSGAEKAASVVKGAASGAASGAVEGAKEEL